MFLFCFFEPTFPKFSSDQAPQSWVLPLSPLDLYALARLSKSSAQRETAVLLFHVSLK